MPVITSTMDRLHAGKTSPQPKNRGFPVDWLWFFASLIPILLVWALTMWVLGQNP